MTREDLFYAWAVIEASAKKKGVPPSEVRSEMKAKLARLWEDEECGKEKKQILHKNFFSSPSVESVLSLMRDLAVENFR